MTDASGAFRLGVPEPGLAVYVHVSARFLTPGAFQRLATGPEGHDLKLVSGVTVTGRLVQGGKPLAGMGVGVVQKDRNGETWVGEFEAATDAVGVFRVLNAPANEQLVLYGLMSSLRRHGALPVRELRTGKSRSVADVGDLEVKAGQRLAGRVVLSDGKPVPAGTRMLLSREEAWDSQQAVVDCAGAVRVHRPAGGALHPVGERTGLPRLAAQRELRPAESGSAVGRGPCRHGGAPPAAGAGAQAERGSSTTSSPPSTSGGGRRRCAGAGGQGGRGGDEVNAGTGDETLAMALTRRLP